MCTFPVVCFKAYRISSSGSFIELKSLFSDARRCKLEVLQGVSLRGSPLSSFLVSARTAISKCSPKSATCCTVTQKIIAIKNQPIEWKFLFNDGYLLLSATRTDNAD